MRARNFVDLTGRVFGRLRVVSFADSVGARVRWSCLCDPEHGGCGVVCVALGYLLKNGTTRSCGCLRREVAAQRKLVHGAARRGNSTPEFKTWQGMIQRCEQSSADSFPLYGGRGIRVCDEWRHDFAAFFTHVGPRPSPKHSIDRINSDGHYEPGNVRWATLLEQMRNKRNTNHVTAFGETLTVGEWAERTGVDAKKIADRLRLGMSPERALSSIDMRTKGMHAPRTRHEKRARAA